MNRPPKQEHDDPAQSSNVKHLVGGVNCLNHGYIKCAEHWNAIDGEMRGGNEKTREWRHNDWYERCALSFISNERVY